jgi:single-strand DNA-binding protein
VSIDSTIIGRLGKDPETRDTEKGEIVSFSLASDHGWGDRKTTTWVRVAVFGQRGRFVRDYCRKGTLVRVAGALYLREWEGKEGKRQDLQCDAWDVSKLSRDEEPGKPQQRDTYRPSRGRTDTTPPDDQEIPF